MKKFLFSAVALVMAAATFTSCSKDEDTSISIIASQTEYECNQGDTVKITPTYTNADATTTYSWTEDGTVIGKESTLKYAAKVSGERTITLTVTGTNSTAKQTFTIKVNEVIRTLTFEGDKWTDLIDNPQYGGELLYGKNADGVVDYSWADAGTNGTKLSSKLTTTEWGNGAYGFAEGGIAISNYVDADTKTHNTYTYQLAVPALSSTNGKNFAVAYCVATMSFSDKRARAINSLDISPTTYELGVAKYGDGYAKALTNKGDNLVLVITGYDKNGKKVDSQEVDMARDGEFFDSWQTITLNGTVNGKKYSFAKAVSYTFTMTGSDASSYGGINTPTYFAFDNVVVNMYAE